MTKITPPEIAPTDMIKLVNFRARKLETVMKDREVVDKLRNSVYLGFTIQEINAMLDNLIVATRKEQANVEN